MFEPTTFPATISELPWITAKIEEISSGREVPSATIVAPTTKYGRPTAMPTISAASVKISDAFTNKARLTISKAGQANVPATPVISIKSAINPLFSNASIELDLAKLQKYNQRFNLY